MGKQKEYSLTIYVGRDSDKDLDELFKGKKTTDIKIPKNALYLKSFEQLHELLSPKKLDLLLYLMDVPQKKIPKTISEVAGDLGRKQEAISRDISHLKKLELIELKKEGQKTYACPKYASIDIKIC